MLYFEWKCATQNLYGAQTHSQNIKHKLRKYSSTQSTEVTDGCGHCDLSFSCASGVLCVGTFVFCLFFPPCCVWCSYLHFYVSGTVSDSLQQWLFSSSRPKDRGDFADVWLNVLDGGLICMMIGEICSGHSEWKKLEGYTKLIGISWIVAIMT